MPKPEPIFRGLFSGDHHMSNALSYARPSDNGRTDRLDNQLAAWEQMREYAHKNNVDGTFLLGDLFDKARLDPVTLVETKEAIRRLSQASLVYILPGNHDAISIRGERFNVEMFRNDRDRIIYLDQHKPLQFGDLAFWPLEYMPVSATLESLASIRTSVSDVGAGINVLLFHNSVVGCEHLAWLCDDGVTPEQLLEGFDWAIGGHFHTHQTFGDDDQGMYTGAWMQHDFGDRGEKRGFWDITFFSDGSREEVHVRSNTPRFWYADPYTVPNKAKPGDYVRWEVPATHAEYEQLKVDLEAAADVFRKDGLNVEYKHRPVYQHNERIITTDEMASVGMPQMVPRYVDSEHVEIGQLDAKRLKALGAEIMQEALHD